MRLHPIMVITSFVLTAHPAEAHRLADSGTPESMQRLLNCRKISDSNVRLTCFDKGSAGIETALSDKDLVVIDRERARNASRSLFGFTSVNFGNLLGGGEEIRQIDTSITSVGHNVDGGLILSLSDGSVWSQTDDHIVGSDPRRGAKISVRRGALGSFFVSGPSIAQFKAKRVG